LDQVVEEKPFHQGKRFSVKFPGSMTVKKTVAELNGIAEPPFHLPKTFKFPNPREKGETNVKRKGSVFLPDSGNFESNLHWLKKKHNCPRSDYRLVNSNFGPKKCVCSTDPYRKVLPWGSAFDDHPFGSKHVARVPLGNPAQPGDGLKKKKKQERKHSKGSLGKKATYQIFVFYKGAFV